MEEHRDEPDLEVITQLGSILGGDALARQGRWDKAIAAYSAAIQANPKDALAQNNLAWLLATCPDTKFRDRGRAVQLAKAAVELAPNDGLIRNTLGVAHYRAGDWRAAIEVLEKAMELRKGGDSFDWFFLAMAYSVASAPRRRSCSAFQNPSRKT
jgi:tetratricopeptide (TPR) repeat protein